MLFIRFRDSIIRIWEIIFHNSWQMVIKSPFSIVDSHLSWMESIKQFSSDRGKCNNLFQSADLSVHPCWWLWKCFAWFKSFFVLTNFYYHQCCPPKRNKQTFDGLRAVFIVSKSEKLEQSEWEIFIIPIWYSMLMTEQKLTFVILKFNLFTKWQSDLIVRKSILVTLLW